MPTDVVKGQEKGMGVRSRRVVAYVVLILISFL